MIDIPEMNPKLSPASTLNSKDEARVQISNNKLGKNVTAQVREKFKAHKYKNKNIQNCNVLPLAGLNARAPETQSSKKESKVLPSIRTQWQSQHLLIRVHSNFFFKIPPPPISLEEVFRCV